MAAHAVGGAWCEAAHLMRIACLSASDQLGGAEIALLEMMRSVRRLRPTCSFSVILPGAGPLLDCCKSQRVSCEVVPLPASIARLGESVIARRHGSAAQPVVAARMLAAAVRLPSYARRLKQALERCSPSVIHSHGVKAHLLAALCGGRVPLVWHLHEYVSARPLSRKLLRQLAGRCTAIAANSNSVASDARAVFADTAPVRVIHNAVDLQRFTPDGVALDLDEASGLDRPGHPVVRVGLVSTFGRWKGHETFLRALATIPADVPVRGYMIGAPLYDTAGSQHSRASLEHLVLTLGLKGRVGFTGFLRSDQAIRALDIIVHASTEPEPFGLVIAEAMACGRSLITTALGGAGEIVQVGIDALVSPPEDHDALADAIRQLATNEPLRHRLGKNARNAAVARFNPDRLGASLVDLYEQCASPTAPHGRTVSELRSSGLTALDR